MTTHDPRDVDALSRATVFDRDGDKIGGVGEVYLDDTTGEPAWVTVNTGLFGLKETFVPLEGASFSGDEIRVPYEKDFVKDAPNLANDEHLDGAAQDELFAYYRDGGRHGDRGGVLGGAAAGGAAGLAGGALTDDRDRNRNRLDGDLGDRDLRDGDLRDRESRDGDPLNEDHDGRRELHGDDRDRAHAPAGTGVAHGRGVDGTGLDTGSGLAGSGSLGGRDGQAGSLGTDGQRIAGDEYAEHSDRSRLGQDGAGQDGAGQDGTRQDGTGQRRIRRYVVTEVEADSPESAIDRARDERH